MWAKSHKGNNSAKSSSGSDSDTNEDQDRNSGCKDCDVPPGESEDSAGNAASGDESAVEPLQAIGTSQQASLNEHMHCGNVPPQPLPELERLTISDQENMTESTNAVPPWAGDEVIIGCIPPHRQSHQAFRGDMAGMLQKLNSLEHVSQEHRFRLRELYLNRELDRLVTFSQWPHGKSHILPSVLAQSGFFYLDSLDRTQCFSCGGVLRNWLSADDEWTEHRHHFPHCRMVHGIENRNIPVPSRPEPEEDRRRNFPCSFPAFPAMRSEFTRCSTFPKQWPKQLTRPGRFSKAGFFYIKEENCVKCWYCLGKLNNVHSVVNPWIEHSKWFPNCQFLLQTKGQYFAHRHLKENILLERPVTPKQGGSPLENIQQEKKRQHEEKVKNVVCNPNILGDVLKMTPHRDLVRALLQNQNTVINNEQNVGRDSGGDVGSDELLAYLLKAMQEQRPGTGTNIAKRFYIQDQNGVQYVVDTGADQSVIPAAPEQRRNVQKTLVAANGTKIPVYESKTLSLRLVNGKDYTHAFDIADVEEKIIGLDFVRQNNLAILPDGALIDLEDGSRITCGNRLPKALRRNDTNLLDTERALEELLGDWICRTCSKKEIDTVFLPCGHRCCCKFCAEALQLCPICDKRIEGLIPVTI